MTKYNLPKATRATLDFIAKGNQIGEAKNWRISINDRNTVDFEVWYEKTKSWVSVGFDNWQWTLADMKACLDWMKRCLKEYWKQGSFKHANEKPVKTRKVRD